VLTTIVFGVLVLATGGSVFSWLASRKEEPPRQDQSALLKTYSVTVFRVEPTDLERIIRAFGTARADREVVIAAEVAGKVVEADRLDVGRSVAAPSIIQTPDRKSARLGGDLLVRIDPQTYEQRVIQVKQMVAADEVDLQKLEQERENQTRLLDTTQANLATARTEYDNAVALRKQSVGTDSAVRRAELEMRQFEDAVIRIENELSLFEVRRQQIVTRRDMHQTELALAELDLQRTEIRPSFPGVISEAYVELGQYVRPGEPLVRITDPNRVEVSLVLTLSDFTELRERADADPGLRVALSENEVSDPRWFSDPLTSLREAPEADERTRTVKVYTTIDNSRQSVPLLPGTFVHARIPGGVSRQALVVPREAVLDDRIFVAVPEPGRDSSNAAAGPQAWFARAERRSIRAVRTLQSLTIVADGLRPGEWIVVSNLDVIHEGARLKIESSGGLRTLPDVLGELRTPQVRVLEPQPGRAGHAE
jgi:RND family efflux transporter MFP subunit